MDHVDAAVTVKNDASPHAPCASLSNASSATASHYLFSIDDYNFTGYRYAQLQLLCDHAILIRTRFPKLVAVLHVHPKFREWVDTMSTTLDVAEIVDATIRALQAYAFNFQGNLVHTSIDLRDAVFWRVLVEHTMQAIESAGAEKTPSNSIFDMARAGEDNNDLSAIEEGTRDRLPHHQETTTHDTPMEQHVRIRHNDGGDADTADRTDMTTDTADAHDDAHAVTTRTTTTTDTNTGHAEKTHHRENVLLAPESPSKLTDAGARSDAFRNQNVVAQRVQRHLLRSHEERVLQKVNRTMKSFKYTSSTGDAGAAKTCRNNRRQRSVWIT